MRLVFLGLMAIAPIALGQANDFPNRHVKIIVPFTSGSGADTASRFFGEQLTGVLGQPFVVENKPGASGTVAVNTVKGAPPDGYTILMGSNSLMAVNPIVMKDLPYDPVKDLKPIAGITRGVSVILVPNNSPFKSVADLVKAAKTDKKSLNAGTYAAGYHLALEWFAGLAGVKFTNVPYKGAAQVTTDVMGNQLDFAIVSFNGAAPLIKAGRLRALAVSAEKRLPAFPDLPTVAESGYPEYKHYTWTSFYVRSDTPDNVTARLADAMQKVLATKASQDYAVKTLVELMPLAPAAMRKFQIDELELHRRVANNAGIEPQ
jgi:tripartite-type tricarboxylate transporter receptor subunit TctC